MTLRSPVLSGVRVRLRPAVPADADARLANGRHREIDEAYGGDGTDLAAFTPEQASHWAATLAADPLAWVIEHDGVMVGEARLHTIDAHDARASYAIGLQLPSLLGRGLGSEATMLVLKHAFGALGLHRVAVRVLANNVRAIRCYQKCGFMVEGREREAARVGGTWQDDLIMGVLATELVIP